MWPEKPAGHKTRAIEAQVESAIVYGLTAALFGEINLEDGRFVQGNFHDYPMLQCVFRFSPCASVLSCPPAP